jgi:fatty-acyl-CoA synthase
MTVLTQSDWCARWALYAPERIALEEADGGRCITYGQLHAAGNALAARLHDRGLIKGERLVVIADFSLELVALFVAAQKAGFILVPLNYRLAPAEIAWMVADADPALILAEAHYAHLLSEVSPDMAKRRGAFTDVEDLVAEACSGSKTIPFAAVGLHADDPVFILYTSGTTGFPKGTLYTHGMLLWNSINTAMSLSINAEGRTLLFMPPFHTGGWNVLLTPFLHHGGYVCLMKKFDPKQVLHLLQSKRVTLFMGVPTMLRMITEQPEWSNATFPDLHYVIVGGEAMPIPLIEAWDARGVAVRQGYGLTEVGPNLTSLHQDDAIRKKGSIGRPNFYVEIQVVREDGQPALPGTRGELRLRGPMVTPGYWRNPEASEKAFVEGWFCTGDVVIEDEAQYLYVVDRLKNMYISGGENVYPAEVERCLLQHPRILEVAVTGIPDPKWGETGAAFVRSDAPAPSPAALQAWCSERLARYKVPRVIVFVEELPKNATGKIDRLRLKQLAATTQDT